MKQLEVVFALVDEMSTLKNVAIYDDEVITAERNIMVYKTGHYLWKWWKFVGVFRFAIVVNLKIHCGGEYQASGKY